MKSQIFAPAIGGLLTLFVLLLQFTELPLAHQALQRLDYLAYDLRLKASLGEKRVDQRVVIVDVDEKSLREEGHWPWPRDRLALLVEELFSRGAAVVGFDMVFSEAERNSAGTVISRLQGRRSLRPLARQLEELRGEFDNDGLFAQGLVGRDVVLGFLFDSVRQQPVGELPLPVVFSRADMATRTALPSASSYIGNLKVLRAAAPHGGFFSLMPDSDGIYRRAPMLQRFGNAVYPALSLEIVRLYTLTDRLDLATAGIGPEEVVEAIKVGDRSIPTDRVSNAMIPFVGEQGTFPYVSATDVLHDNVSGAPFAGNIVLIGTTAKGLSDLRATPVQGTFPGVEIHANLIAGILDNRFPVEPSWAEGANFMMTLLTGMVLSLLLPRLSPATMVFASMLLLGAVLGGNYLLWNRAGLILSLAPQVLLITSISPFNIAYGFWRESHDRRRLKEMFGQYVPPQLVEQMNQQPHRDYGFRGESREVSILFCDIRDFTSISERLGAARLKEMLNQFFTPMTRIIFEHGGTIDKYVGDMIMAFWGAPLDDPAHAKHAVAAAMEMIAEAEQLSATFLANGLPSISLGIGINSGTVNVGDMGSEYRRAYTVIGDAVNLASRLEGATKYYGARVLIGETTWRQIDGALLCRELDRVCVKGKTEAVRVYEPLCRNGTEHSALEQELIKYAAALASYRARDWERADSAFASLQVAYPEVKIYGLYRERIANLRLNDPGESWEGVHEIAEK